MAISNNIKNLMSLMETFEQSKRRAPHAERAKKGATRKHSL